ncbi:MAG: PFL family protein [Armatimonadia bacterium]
MHLFNTSEVMETLQMIEEENLDIRTITMGISLRDCTGRDLAAMQRAIREKIVRLADRLVPVAQEIAHEFGIPIINKRLSVTPIGLVGDGHTREGFLALAQTLDETAREVGVDFIGGFSALVHKGYTRGDAALIEALPEALASTQVVCSSVNVATTRAGINMDAVAQMGEVLKETARLTAAQCGLGCAKLVVFANATEDNPFMAGAFHGIGEPEVCVNVGVSGPGVVKRALEKVPDGDLGAVSETVKKTAFKITRMGQVVAQEASRRLNVPFGIVDLSLAPTSAVGDSVAHILEEMGLEKCGAAGSTAALALLNDAVKKGGLMATSYAGGLSGAFIPVSEDLGMIEAAEAGVLTIEKLEAMTAVCSVGLDMIAVPGDTPAETLSAIIADEAAIGVINNKTTAVRLIPAPGKKVGEMIEFGGLLGRAPIMPVSSLNSSRFVKRGGRIPAPLQGLRN